MRIPVSFLVLCAAITGCTPSIDPALVEVVSINSNPQGAAFRLNGVASGRTPAEVSLDRSADYKLEVGKGGYEGEVRYLKPSLQNTKDGLSFGFGGKPIVVTLTKLPGADDAAVPEGDADEFKKLKNATNGEDPGAPGTVKANIAAVQDAAAKVKQALAKQEAAATQKVAGLQKLLDQAKAAAAAENADAKAIAQASEAEVALAAAIAEVAAEKAKGAATLEALEARRQALLNKVEVGAAQDAAKAIDT
ncbi:MAG: PEGA domain-containing protein, partial [Opitutia bacterium]